MTNRILSIDIVDGELIVTYQDGTTESLGPVANLDPEELSAAVIRNASDIAGLRRDVTALQTSVAALDTAVGAVETAIEGVQDDIDDIEEDVTELKNDLNQHLIRYIEATSGEIVTGEVITSSGGTSTTVNFNRTDYIDITGCGGSYLTAHCSILALYDDEYTTIAYAENTSTVLWGDVTVYAPAGTKYIRMCGPAGSYTAPSDFNVSCSFFTDIAMLDDFADTKTVEELSDTVGEPLYANLVDPDKIIDAKAINASTGVAQDNSNGWSVTGFLFLRKNTVYTFGRIYSQGFYAFYTAPNESAFVANPDASVARQGANDNYYGYITVGSSDLYFRGSFSTTNKASVFVSSAYGEYKPYGIIPVADQLKNPPCRFGKILIVGDSISAYNYGNYKKWVQFLTDQGYFMADVNNNSVHATGYIATLSGNHDDTFPVRLKAVTSPSSYDLVVVFGGVNDFIQNVPMGSASDSETQYFVPAVDDFYSYLATNFLNARVLVILPMKCGTAYNSSGEPTTNTQSEKLSDYADYIKTVAEKYSFPVFDLLNESGFYPWLTAFKNTWTHSSDGLHPTADYSEKFLAPLIKQFINKY